MPGDSAIAWTNHTHNAIVVGCDETNEGCDNCYARDWHNKWHRIRQGALETDNAALLRSVPRQYDAPFSPARRMREVLGDAAYEKRLNWPLTVKKPGMIFVNSMTDWLHSVATDDDIFEYMAMVRKAHWHTFQFLTKRYGRLLNFGPQIDWPSNAWAGISIAMNKYVPALSSLSIGAADASVRFLSLEPLLDDLVNLTATRLRAHNINWVIVGAESGTGMKGAGRRQRPIVHMEEDWVRRIRDACVAADVAFFYKQSVDKSGHKTQLPELDGQVWAQYPQGAK